MFCICCYPEYICTIFHCFKEKFSKSQGSQEKHTKVSQIWLQICLIVFHNILNLPKALLILQELKAFPEVIFSALHNLGFCRSRPLLCHFNSHLYPGSVWGTDQAAPVENSNMGLALRGKDTQIFVLN